MAVELFERYIVVLAAGGETGAHDKNERVAVGCSRAVNIEQEGGAMVHAVNDVPLARFDKRVLGSERGGSARNGERECGVGD